MAAGSTRPEVWIPKPRFGNAVVNPKDVHSIVAHRLRSNNEEYLVKWKWHGIRTEQPFSWHPICELAGADGVNYSSRYSCLAAVQAYLDAIQPDVTAYQQQRTLKRKRASYHDAQVDYQASVAGSRASSASIDATDASSSTSADVLDTYNCKIRVRDGFVRMKPVTRLSRDTSNYPTPEMQQQSLRARSNIAANKIRFEFIRSLALVPGKNITFSNTRDTSTPSLKFRFINDYIYRQGVEPPDPSSVVGCGVSKSKGLTCRPNMGGDCGCEYTRICECLEYAKIDEKKLKSEDLETYQDYESGLRVPVMGLPKRFPYSKRTGLLVDAYLQERFPIYECNEKCACGPGCKSRVVQKGRTVGLEIFRTKNRGWGLRALEPIARGQFIDTYRGEVITKDEADERERVGGKGKDSYLFSLDKFTEEEDDEHLYEIDGEFYGGPTRFINHSCDPNCYVYVVSKNKNNAYLYEVAFFASKDIAVGTELTFDYKDQADEPQDLLAERSSEGVDEDSIPCRCGSSKCRQWLWK